MRSEVNVQPHFRVADIARGDILTSDLTLTSITIKNKVMNSSFSSDQVFRDQIVFTGSHDNRIAGEFYSPPVTGVECRVALLIHGGGQTRHSWGGTARTLAENGWISVIIDQRGHGDSEWNSEGEYEFSVFAEDLRHIAKQIFDRFGVLPVTIGASLGGIASMLVAGESESPLLSALVLVDITPRMRQSGVEKIIGFMAQNADSGFSSLEDAADAIAAYLPHRPRPKSLDGLAKNLRKHADGRYRWHWDPKFIGQREKHTKEEWTERENRLINAARNIITPTLLIRGGRSELVSEAEVEEFLSLVPHAKFTDVSEAGHMIAGDRNDIFTDAVMEFLNAL